jgi:3-hydroxybutyrate dehydrogenase
VPRFFVRTPLVEHQIREQADAHGIEEERVLEDVILAPHAIKSLIEPAEVAGVVEFLLSPAGRAFTGAPVTMDQGWTARYGAPEALPRAGLSTP